MGLEIGLNEANQRFVVELSCDKVRATLVEVDEDLRQRVTKKGMEILMGEGFIELAPRDCGITSTPLRLRTPDTFSSCIDCDFSRVTDDYSDQT